MPRISDEARSAAYWRAGGKPPRPPAHLSKKAQALWREITGSRPPDYFRPGATVLLAGFCELAISQEVYLSMLADDPLNHELQRAVNATAQVLNTTAQKLRLTPQSTVRREAGILNEKGFDPEPGSTRHDTLFGANVIKF